MNKFFSWNGSVGAAYYRNVQVNWNKTPPNRLGIENLEEIIFNSHHGMEIIKLTGEDRRKMTEAEVRAVENVLKNMARNGLESIIGEAS